MNDRYCTYADAELIHLMGGDDVQAFVTLYDRYARELYNFVYRKVGKREDSEDIVQDIFISFWKKRDRLPAIQSLKVYFFQCGKYQIFNYLRSKYVRERYSSDLSLYQGDRHDNSVEEQINLSDTSSVVERTVAGLSDKCRLIFQLSRVEHMSIQEIAERLNLSRRTIENNLSQALKRLRNQEILSTW